MKALLTKQYEKDISDFAEFCVKNKFNKVVPSETFAMMNKKLDVVRMHRNGEYRLTRRNKVIDVEFEEIEKNEIVQSMQKSIDSSETAKI